MTTKEASRVLEYKATKLLGDYILKEMPPQVKEFYDALDLAITTMEKQIPKKKHKYQGYRCTCGAEVAKNQDYCECCGQRLLEWEGD